jgi:hypothetical protein
MPAYPAALAAAPRIHTHFARLPHTQPAATDVPALPAIETLLDVAFWASLRREEGYEPTISLALMPPDVVPRPLRFARHVPLRAADLAKLAPAVERPGIHLGVWPHDGHLSVWGTTIDVPPATLVVEVIAPGVLVVKHRRDWHSAKFANVAVLEGDQVRILDQRVPTQPECPRVVSSLFGFDSLASWVESADVLVQLAISMRAHRRGGALLVVPPGTNTWDASVVAPVTYEVQPWFTALADLMHEADQSGMPDAQKAGEEALTRLVTTVAGLTAVDGATIITSRYELVAFGAKLTRRSGHAPVERVRVVEPVEGREPADTHPVLLGGTRHLSAAQFVQDQREAVALVASQDGRFTVFSWSSAHDVVTAYRVEALLL